MWFKSRTSHDPKGGLKPTSFADPKLLEEPIRRRWLILGYGEQATVGVDPTLRLSSG